MLKIQYTSYFSETLIDVEEYICSLMKTDDIGKWLESKIPTISFAYYDFPCDEVYSYEEYFTSVDECVDGLEIKFF